MGFRSLRVINEDRIAAEEGFGTHGHRDMEIVTYVLSGALAHQDSMGNGSTIHAGDVQYMSAGKGVRHSEANAAKSGSGATHLLQIWILPNVQGAEPRYDQKHFERDEKLNRLRLILSPDGSQGSIAVRQDVQVSASILEAGKELQYSLPSGRGAWVHVALGSVELNGKTLGSGDAAAIEDETGFKLRGLAPESDLLIFDLK